MLNHPRSQGFIKNFLAQWLDLRLIDFTTPDGKLYPEFDDALRRFMVEETELFFAELLKRDLSVVNFVDSDFAMLNERLAQHYGIAGVKGPALRRVDATAWKPSRGSADPGERAQGDGQWDDDLARDSWGLGLAEHPWQAPGPAAAQCGSHRAGHPRGKDHSRTTRQAPKRSILRFLPCEDRSARLCAGKLRCYRRNGGTNIVF
jgi:Protein of unknown function (DUF1592).